MVTLLLTLNRFQTLFLCFYFDLEQVNAAGQHLTRNLALSQYSSSSSVGLFSSQSSLADA